jgi:hypothetical protein
MSTRPIHIALAWAGPALLGFVAGLVGSGYLPESDSSLAVRQASVAPPVRFAIMSVSLPPGKGRFPPGKGSNSANAQCVMCHSTGMVLRQPPLTDEEWKVEVMKMRNAFGAPVPADKVDALARYLHSINGRQADTHPSGVDKQAS